MSSTIEILPPATGAMAQRCLRHGCWEMPALFQAENETTAARMRIFQGQLGVTTRATTAINQCGSPLGTLILKGLIQTVVRICGICGFSSAHMQVWGMNQPIWGGPNGGKWFWAFWASCGSGSKLISPNIRVANMGLGLGQNQNLGQEWSRSPKIWVSHGLSRNNKIWYSKVVIILPSKVTFFRVSPIFRQMHIRLRMAWNWVAFKQAVNFPVSWPMVNKSTGPTPTRSRLLCRPFCWNTTSQRWRRC